MSPKTTPRAPRVSAAAPPAWTPRSRPWRWPSAGVCSVVVVAGLVFAVVRVERLAGQLAAAAVEHRDVERVAAVVVGRQQREAVLDQHALVDGQAGQLRRRDGDAVDDRCAPYERHGGDRADLAAPAAYHL